MTRETGERAAIPALEPPPLVELRRLLGRSRDLLSPALLIMDALLKAFGQWGWKYVRVQKRETEKRLQRVRITKMQIGLKDPT
jgi:hypothetical protein